MDLQKIKIKNDYKIADIIHDIGKGTLRIPQFQREFIWDKPKVIKLLESIYLEYPIGSFFFWDSPRKYYNFYRDIAELDIPKPDKYDKLMFILDGQQRITSLYVTIKGLKLFAKDYKNICFDLDLKKFVDRKPDNERFISLSDLLSNDRYIIYDKLNTERKISFNECYQRFNNYPFSGIDIRDKELDEVCDIFERINQGGQRLNLFDLISAGTWSGNFDLRKEVNNINEGLKQKGFGELSNEVYIQALSLLAKNSCTRESQLQLRTEDIDKYWKDNIDSIFLAIDFIRSNLGVVNYDFIPYPGVISVLSYLFYKHKLKSLFNKQSDLVKTWFWLTALSERYGASTLTIMTEDAKLMNKIEENKITEIKIPLNLDTESLIKITIFRKSAIRNAIFCLLALKEPRHFKNNTLLPLRDPEYSDFNSKEKHHIFPKSVIEKSYPFQLVNSIVNFCFIPAELNKEISNKKPSDYFERFSKLNPEFNDTLKSHMMVYDESIKHNDYISLIYGRATLLLEELYKMTGSKILQIASDNVNNAIDKIETSLRDFIDEKLIEVNKNYWKKNIPGDIIDSVKQKVKEYAKKDPSFDPDNLSSRDLLNFCDIMDYEKIISVNWTVFENKFGSLNEMQKRFASFKEYRNAIKHNRGIMAAFIKKEGEAALEWLSIILEKKSGNGEYKANINDYKNDFVKWAIKGIPNWIRQDFPDGNVYIGKIGSGYYKGLYTGTKGQKRRFIKYSFAKEWVYIELSYTNNIEVDLLKSRLTKPETMKDIPSYQTKAFRIYNQEDFGLLKEIVLTRFQRN